MGNHNGPRGDRRTRGSRPVAKMAILAVLTVTLTTAGARILLVRFGQFDGLYGQDAYAYYNYAVGPVRESLLTLERLPSFAWPPGYPILVALASFGVGARPLAGQLVSFVAALLLPIFSSLLAWQLYFQARDDAWGAALCGIVVSVTGQLWQSSVVVMADIPALTAATIGVWAVACYGMTREKDEALAGGRLLFLAAGAMALSILIRWAYALVSIPVAIYGLIALRQRPRNVALLQGTTSAVLVLVILSPLLDTIWKASLGRVAEAAYAVDLQVYSWQPANVFKNSFKTADGFLSYDFPNGLYYATAAAHRYYLAPILALFLLPGLLVSIRRTNNTKLLLLLGWPSMVIAFHAGAPWQNYRFALAYLPPMALLVSIGFRAAVEHVPPRARVAIFLWLAAGLAMASFVAWDLTDQFIDRKQADLETVQWISDKVASGANILVFELTLTLQQYSDLDTRELFYETPETVQKLLEQGRPTYLLINVDRVESQWLGRAPSINYRWLMDGPGLVELGHNRGFTLYLVGEGARPELAGQWPLHRLCATGQSVMTCRRRSY